VATALGAVDPGYRVILVRDSSLSDKGHDALLQVHNRRYIEQIETADARNILIQLDLAKWRSSQSPERAGRNVSP
jgi:nicotinamidase-related amidase